MSLIACKYLPSIGWVGCKNDDKRFKPTFKVSKSFRGGIERLMVWDEISKYTEGINEFGVAILFTQKGLSTQYQEAKKVRSTGSRYYSPAGFIVRKALLEKSPSEAAHSLIESKIIGHAIVFNQHQCYVLDSSGEEYRIQEAKPNEIIVRSNYYPGDDSNLDMFRSSQLRCDCVTQALLRAQRMEDVLDSCSIESPNTDSQKTPLLKKNSRTDEKTVSQLVLVPETKTLHFRPLWGDTSFDLDSLNSEQEKTFFEVVSTRKLMTFRKLVGESWTA